MSAPDDRLPDAVAAAFAADVGVPAASAAAWAPGVLARVRPELARQARRAYRRGVVRALVLALLPLPLVLAAQAVVLRLLWELASAWLPAALATTLVMSHAVAAVAGLGLAYALIPLLLAARLPGVGGRDEVPVS